MIQFLLGILAAKLLFGSTASKKKMTKEEYKKWAESRKSISPSGSISPTYH